MTLPRVGFLGLGIMGSGMVRRLLGAGFPVTVYNRNSARMAPLVAAGAQGADSPRVAATGAAVVISMVADDAASRALWLGHDGALAGIATGAVAIECSTLTVAWIQELAKAVAVDGCVLLDAPVTGSKNAAAAGELNFLVGGPAAALEQVRPVLAPMSRSITHFGPTGSGAFVKLVNNVLSGIQVAAFAEALAWLERGNVDRAQALAVLTEGAPGSPIVKLMAGRMTTPDYTPNFLLRLMAKDIGYAIDEAREQGLALRTAEAALQRFRGAIEAGCGEQDMAAVIEPMRGATRDGTRK